LERDSSNGGWGGEPSVNCGFIVEELKWK
jgi:hypothetical protein